MRNVWNVVEGLEAAEKVGKENLKGRVGDLRGKWDLDMLLWVYGHVPSYSLK